MTGCCRWGRGAFGSNVNHYPNGTVICDKDCYDTMCAQDAEDFYTVRLLLLHSKLHKRRLKAVLACAQWGKADSRVAAIAPWNWGGCASCNGSRFTPSHTCCMDELGAREQPLTRAAWTKIGKAIKAAGGSGG